jgi:8-oxo-dGTP pyrophosphatase MutT (NUDIX family)
MTAIRETFEETGLLLASASATSESESELPQQSPPSPSLSPSLSEAALDASRESIHTGRTLFRDFLKQHALSADVKALLPFTEWITPLGYSRCVHALRLSHTHTHSHSHNQHAKHMLTTAHNTAASTRVSTSLSCPLSARPGGGASHHFPRE